MTDGLLSRELGYLFVGTSRGVILEYLYPFSSQKCYRRLVLNQPVAQLRIDQPYENLLCMGAQGQVVELKLKQYISGQASRSTYLINEQGENHSDTLKLEFTNRNYLLNGFTLLSSETVESVKETMEEC